MTYDKKWVNFTFTPEFKKKLTSKIPELVKQFLSPTLDIKDEYGHVRFEGDELKAFYINYVHGEFTEPNHVKGKQLLLKYKYVSGEVEFDKFYFIDNKTTNSGEYWHETLFDEHRYDLDMNLCAKYKHYDMDNEPIANEEGTHFVIAEQYERDGKEINPPARYITTVYGKKFPDKLKFLEKEGIIENHEKNNELFSYFWKDKDKNTIYLGLGKTWIL